VAVSFTSVPSWYAKCSFPKRNGVFYVGGVSPSLTLSQAGATAYQVRNYYGDVVSSGSVSGTTCTPTAPAGGWTPGWYRIYFTGPNLDSVVGYSYSATSFTVIRDDPHFPQMPSGGINFYGGENADPVAKGILGLGMSRHVINSYAAPTNVDQNLIHDTISTCLAQAAVTNTYWSTPGSPYADSARPRPLWCSTPGAVADVLSIPGSSSGTFLCVYAKDGSIDPGTVFVASGPGTSSGSKVTIYHPDAVTVAEAYDDLASGAVAETAINAASALVKVFNGGQAAAGSSTATTIGRTVLDGVIQVVTALYPAGVTRFEFTNEPTATAETVHRMRLFAAAVHAGNPSAKAIGPCTGDMGNPGALLALGIGQWCDEISFHDYNSMTCGNLELGRRSIEALLAQLQSLGLSGKTLWQTEAGGATTGVYGVHHPRRARVKILHTLLWEQYGIPKERNPYWYDRGHGYWSDPMFWQCEDTSISPDAALHRVLSEEIWGKTHSQRLAFGTLGDRIVLGSVYSGSSDSIAVLIAASHMPGATVTLDVTGLAASLVTVDAFGNTSTVPVGGGRAVVPVTDVPTYVRLPSGVSVTVHHFSDWPSVASLSAWESQSPLASSPLPALTDGHGMTGYPPGSAVYLGSSTLPDTVTLTWPNAVRLDRVLIWNAMSWQGSGSLVDFDVQTSVDGSAWVTQATVTKDAAASFKHGTSSTNVWCTQETFWDEQWIFDVPLPRAVTCKAVRLYVRSASYGGEPDAAAANAGGQGNSNPVVGYQEIAVLCDDNTKPQYVRAV
jgi:hypothetical protein